MRTRLQDWPLRLDSLIQERRCMPFAWGAQDCCQFARAAVVAVTGRDPAAEWGLPPYETALGASRLLATLGGVASLPPRAGLTSIPPLMAQRGDLVLVAGPDGHPALGVCIGISVAAPSALGLEYLPMSAGTAAWRVS